MMPLTPHVMRPPVAAPIHSAPLLTLTTITGSVLTVPPHYGCWVHKASAVRTIKQQDYSNKRLLIISARCTDHCILPTS
jgi:hypothetical protein